MSLVVSGQDHLNIEHLDRILAECSEGCEFPVSVVFEGTEPPIGASIVTTSFGSNDCGDQEIEMSLVRL